MDRFELISYIIDLVNKLCQDLYKIEIKTREEQQKQLHPNTPFFSYNQMNRNNQQNSFSISIGTQAGFIDALAAIINYSTKKGVLPDFDLDLNYSPRKRKVF